MPPRSLHGVGWVTTPVVLLHSILKRLQGYDVAFCSRTPAPPPFSEMNSTPAASIGRWIASRVEGIGLAPPVSKRLMVATATPERSAKTFRDPSRAARDKQCQYTALTPAADVSVFIPILEKHARNDKRMAETGRIQVRVTNANVDLHLRLCVRRRFRLNAAPSVEVGRWRTTSGSA